MTEKEKKGEREGGREYYYILKIVSTNLLDLLKTN